MDKTDKKWTLNDASEKAPFDVPKNYFEKNRYKIMAEIEELDSPQKKGIIHHLRPALGLVASFILVGLLVYVPMKMYMPSVLDKYYGQASDQVKLNSDSTLIFADLEAMNYFTEEYSLTEPENTQQPNEEELLNYLVAELDDYEIMALSNSENYN